MKRIEIDRAAEAEIAHARDEYDSKEQNLGREFIAELESVVTDIAKWPWVGTKYGETLYLFRVLRRFPYVIFFREFDDAIWIAAVAHGRQRPNYWIRRRRRK